MCCVSWNKEVAEETKQQKTVYRTAKSLTDFSLRLHPILLLSSVPLLPFCCLLFQQRFASTFLMILKKHLLTPYLFYPYLSL